jgi:hypothetical protein
MAAATFATPWTRWVNGNEAALRALLRTDPGLVPPTH